MKSVICLFSAVLLATGCQQQNQFSDPVKIASRLGYTNIEPHMNMLAGSKIHTGKLSESEQSELAEEGKARMLELIKVAPFTLPKQGEVLSITLQEADSKYRKFAAEHKDQPILFLFRQQYARLILNNYNLIESDDYDKIKYYTNELLEGQSFDFRTLTLSLLKLNGRTDASYLKSSIRKMMPIMQHRYELEQVALASIKKMNGKVEGVVSKKNPTDEDKQTLLGLDRLKYKLENSSTKECIAILNDLNSQLSSS